MKVSKRKFVIIKNTDGKYTIALRNAPEHPLATFDTKDAANKRLNQYIKKVNKEG